MTGGKREKGGKKGSSDLALKEDVCEGEVCHLRFVCKSNCLGASGGCFE
jgi:hypothetical protein